MPTTTITITDRSTAADVLRAACRPDLITDRVTVTITATERGAAMPEEQQELVEQEQQELVEQEQQEPAEQEQQKPARGRKTSGGGG